MQLRNAEKNLSEFLIFDHKLRFTTFQPVSSTPGTCGASSTSTGRYYVLNLDDATPTSDNVAIDESSLVKSDRDSEISGLGIASTPAIVFPASGGDAQIYGGVENVGSVSETVKRMYWKKIH